MGVLVMSVRDRFWLAIAVTLVGLVLFVTGVAIVGGAGWSLIAAGGTVALFGAFVVSP